MAKLTASKRNALPASAFALPSQRKYPMNDRSHEIRAKGRAKEMENKGVISESTEEKIVAKANRKLRHGGEMKHASEYKHGVGAERIPTARRDDRGSMMPKGTKADYDSGDAIKVPEETVDTGHGHVSMALESHGKTHHTSKARKVGPHPLAKHFDNHEKRR